MATDVRASGWTPMAGRAPLAPTYFLRSHLRFYYHPQTFTACCGQVKTGFPMIEVALMRNQTFERNPAPHGQMIRRMQIIGNLGNPADDAA